MGINKVMTFCLAFVMCAGLLATPLSAHAEENAPIPEAYVSYWAREGVLAAYEAGLLTPNFDLGTDYSKPISRARLAHLIVGLIAVEKGKSLEALAAEQGIIFKANTPSPSPTPSEAPISSAEALDELSKPAPAPAPTTNCEAECNSQTSSNLPIQSELSEPSAFPSSSSTTPLVNAEQELPEIENGSFLDTKNAYVEIAARLKIVMGAEGYFRPEDNITRAEAAAMLQRCMAVLGVTEANAAPKIFSDAYAIPRWAVEAVKFVSGRIDGTGTALMGGSNGLFIPFDSFTIEQSILTLNRMHATKSLTNTYPGWRDAPGYDFVKISLTFGGDCTFGRGRDFSYQGSFDEMYDKKGANYFFSGINEFFNDDLTMVNFEGTLTGATSPAVKTFVFKGRPEYAKILPAGSIDVVTVANNHSMDYLQRGFNDTIQNLSPYVAVSGFERMPIITVKGIKIGFASNLGWGFDNAQKQFIQNAVKSLRSAGADLVIFNYHWGVERAYHSNKTQQDIAHYCIDQGADLVIGHHPHVVQETETYKGKQIAYSLGNLVFGGNHNPADKNCLIFRQSFTLDLNTRSTVSEAHSAIPYRISSVNGRNDYHPVRAA
ncbi:MAG: CapA family protein [Oscillospiraceae bacterium]